jgi:pyridoxamine 5'-phosphate oxidase
MSLSDLRRDYTGTPLDETTAETDPLRQFTAWFADARQQEHEPTAMSIATVDATGRPAVRIVLLKGVDERGFVFFTNYQSRKGRELSANPLAAIVFYWPTLNRQVRIDGFVERVSGDDSDAYFASRPPESRLAAFVSPQSEVIGSRLDLEERFAEARERFPDAGMGRPVHWGGYRVIPEAIEFWQGRPNRLHDRLRYQRQVDASWVRVRLAP